MYKKSVVVLQICNEHFKNETKKAISFTAASRIKYLRINLTKEE
jgi:hypothetical protein